MSTGTQCQQSVHYNIKKQRQKKYKLMVFLQRIPSNSRVYSVILLYSTCKRYIESYL